MTSNNKKVIVFDDDEDLLFVFSSVLRILGYEVHNFTDCNDVVKRVGSIEPLVIFMDNWIPDNGGIAATQLLKQSAYKSIPVIYFTANNEIASLAAEAGADSWLAKPFTIADVKTVIEDVCKSQE